MTVKEVACVSYAEAPRGQADQAHTESGLELLEAMSDG